MLGIFIALLIGLYNIVIQHVAFEPVFLITTSFLLKWYVITSIIMGVIVILITIGIIGVGTASGGLPGFLVTLIGGGAISTFVLFMIAIRRGLFIGGAFLLHTSLTMQDEVYVWSTPHLIIGGILLLIAVIMGRSSSSS